MTDWDLVLRLCREALALQTTERRAFFDKACAGDPALRRQLVSLFEQGSDTSADVERDDSLTGEGTESTLFKSSPLEVLGSDTLGDLLSVMRLHDCEPGELLIRQGDPAEFLLLIFSGTATARVRQAPTDSERPPVGTFGPGDIVGEISLVTNEPRTADVVADTAMRCLRLSASDFHVMAERHPDLLLVLTEVVADRLGHARYDGLGGKEIHGYRIAQCVGRGGMGVVYEARQVATGRRVALKMMNHRLIYQLTALRRFRREAAILATLDHPSLARLYECFSAYKTEFLAMEFCPGPALNQVIASRGPLGEETVRRLLGQLALALKYVHGRGIIHRDLKPSNIVLGRDGSIKLLDFGIVTVEKGSDLLQGLNSGSQAVSLLGTPRYMAPEQFSGRDVDRRADLYGVACVAYEALCGRPVVAASDVFDIIRERAQFMLPPREQIGAGISEEMHTVLAGGLMADPDLRSIDLDRLASWAGPIDLEVATA
jgi:CRP-like cAMP-binding protein